MKLSQADDVEATLRAWNKYVDSLIAIDNCIAAAANGVGPPNRIKIFIGETNVLDDAEEAFGSDPDDFTREELLSLMRKAAAQRLKEFASELRSLGVEIDWFNGLPDDIADQIGKADAVASWRQRYRQS